MHGGGGCFCIGGIWLGCDKVRLSGGWPQLSDVWGGGGIGDKIMKTKPCGLGFR